MKAGDNKKELDRHPNVMGQVPPHSDEAEKALLDAAIAVFEAGYALFTDGVAGFTAEEYLVLKNGLIAERIDELGDMRDNNEINEAEYYWLTEGKILVELAGSGLTPIDPDDYPMIDVSKLFGNFGPSITVEIGATDVPTGNGDETRPAFLLLNLNFATLLTLQMEIGHIEITVEPDETYYNGTYDEFGSWQGGLCYAAVIVGCAALTLIGSKFFFTFCIYFFFLMLYLIDLSIMVNAMKPHFEKDGAFAKFKLSDIESQQRIILNFYSVIRDAYTAAKIWDKKNENPFIKGAGFNGAFDFLVEHLIPRCQTDRKFTKEHMAELMKLDSGDLITQSEIKSSDGKSGRKKISSFLFEMMRQDIPTNPEEYEF